METVASYTINEAANLLKLSPKTIRRYIKAGKLPSTKVPTKFGDEYRITQIPEELKQEALEQAEAEAKMEIVSPDEPNDKLEVQQIYQDNLRLAAQLGAATERIRQLEEQLKSRENLLAPTPTPPSKTPWWKRLFRIN